MRRPQRRPQRVPALDAGPDGALVADAPEPATAPARRSRYVRRRPPRASPTPPPSPTPRPAPSPPVPASRCGSTPSPRPRSLRPGRVEARGSQPERPHRHHRQPAPRCPARTERAPHAARTSPAGSGRRSPSRRLRVRHLNCLDLRFPPFADLFRWAADSTSSQPDSIPPELAPVCLN